MKRLLIIAIFSILPLVGFGCKGLSSAQQQAIRPVAIEYWAVNEDIAMLRTFAEEYRQFRPYVQITIRQVRDDQLSDLFVNALADDRPPDILSVPVRELPKYQARLSPMPSSVQVANVYTTGGLSPETVVEPVVNQMPTTQTISRSYIRAVEEGAIIGGRVFGLPLSVDTMALYVNRGVLDASGVPELPHNWDEFTEAAKRSTRFNAAGQIVQSGVAFGRGDNIPNAFDILSLLWIQNGVRLDQQGISALTGGLQRDLSGHPTFQTLRFYTDFARADRDVYSWDAAFTNARDEFVRGRSAFYFGFASERRDIRSRAPQMNMEVLPLPQLDPTSPVNIIDFRVQAVAAKSTRQNEAWDFLRYISLPQNVERYLGATSLPTPLRSQVQAQSELSEMEPFLNGILTAVNWYQGRDSVAVQDALSLFITRYTLPYAQDDRPDERDMRLLDTFVRTVQQSL